MTKQFIKHIKLFFALSMLLLSCDLNTKTEKELPIIKSNTETIKYVIGEGSYRNWNIMPELKPDRLELECEKGGTGVGFITDVDSIEFTINEGDTVQFYVLLNEKDSALTEIVGLRKNANFSDEYIQQNKGKFGVKIPEVHELANIMVAISNIGRQDSNMVDMTTAYHAEVMKHFLLYENHPAIDTINKYITGVFDQESYWYYYALKMNACGYIYDESDKIVDDNIIHKMGFNSPGDPFITQKELYEDFAKQSGFRQFFSSHKAYYDSLVSSYKQLNPIDKMQGWLEDKFPYEYGGYLVTFSPLVNGAHSTQRFEDNGFIQTVMFVCSAYSSDKDNQNVNEIRSSRVVFTEIDHNFVNPVSYEYAELIGTALAEREKWVKEGDGTGGYGSPMNVFNEYMTWAIFSPYCYDNYPETDVNEYIPKMEKFMVKDRGFILFDQFNQQLIALYKDNPKIEIDSLYKEMISWCAKQ